MSGSSEAMLRRDVLAGAGAALATATPAIAVVAPAPRGPRQPADLVLTNAKVLTVDRDFRIADSIAIGGDRVLAVGPRQAMAAVTAPGTRTLDLEGKTIVPGLIDTHAHMDLEVAKSVWPTLAGVRSIRDLQDRIRELARARKPGEWIVTGPLGDPPDYLNVPDILAEKRWPTRQELDAAAPDNPVLIKPMSGYLRGPPMTAIANTEALKRAGITRDTTPPVRQLVVVKDAAGEPMGVITETALPPYLESTWFREPTTVSYADRVRGVPASQAAYHAFGTTGIYEGHGLSSQAIRAYKEAHRTGALTMRAGLVLSPNWRVAGNAPVEAFLEAWGGAAGAMSLGDDRLKVCGLYTSIGDPAAGGLPRDRVKEILLACARNDIRVSMNFGRQGSIELLDEVHREIPLDGRRWVVTHFNVIPPRDVERIARMGLVLTSHFNEMVVRDGHLYEQRLPPEQWGWNTPMRDLMSAGVKVGLVTDNNPVTLWRPIQGAVTRRSAATGQRLSPQQAVSRQEALRCATMCGAYITWDEDKRGSLEPGKLADLAVLTADPLTVSDAALADIAAEMTMIGGKIVHEARKPA